MRLEKGVQAEFTSMDRGVLIPAERKLFPVTGEVCIQCALIRVLLGAASGDPHDRFPMILFSPGFQIEDHHAAIEVRSARIEPSIFPALDAVAGGDKGSRDVPDRSEGPSMEGISPKFRKRLEDKGVEIEVNYSGVREQFGGENSVVGGHREVLLGLGRGDHRTRNLDDGKF